MKKILFPLALFLSAAPLLAGDVVNYGPPKRPPGWEEQQNFLRAIAEKKVIVGMTPEQCLQAWGKPSSVDRTVSENHAHEIWWYHHAYEKLSALYFTDGVLTTAQE